MNRPKRLLGLPAWTWPLASLALVGAAVRVPPPGPMAEPEHAATLARQPLLVTRDGEGFAVVPYGKHEGIGPVWALGLRSVHHTSVDRQFGLGSGEGWPGAGFYRRQDQWRYELTAGRYDSGSGAGQAESSWLPDEEAAALRPLAVAELDRRSGRLLGSQLAALLDEGLERESRVCPQNALVLAAWLSIPLGLWGMGRTIAAAGSGPARDDIPGLPAK